MVTVSTIFLILAVIAMRAPVSSGAQLRLVRTNSLSSGGRLEIYYSYAWRPFCSTYFNSHEADLACRKLGYLRASSYGRVGLYGYSRSSGYYSSVRTTCYSYYSTFDSCSNSITSCSTYYDVGVICSRSTTYSPTSSPTSRNSLRLVSSSTSSSAGRLEIYYYYSGRYAWRPFCSTSFNGHEANLACQKLGYSYASAYGRVGFLGYSQGTGSYSVLANCYSSSTSFDSCPKSITSGCSHYYDVAVTCYKSDYTDGIVLGLVVPVVSVFACCGGIHLCAIIIACIIHHSKKRSNGPRTVNVVPPTHTGPNTATSMTTFTTTVTTEGKKVVPDAAPPYTPSPYTSSMQQQEPYYPPMAGNNPDACPAYGEETKSSF